ncbi:MAG TPA: hypothetical protein PKJ69_08750 [Spirochaetota bacterium]|nr:hypothetical protein [Spirochaetota bacterium]
MKKIAGGVIAILLILVFGFMMYISHKVIRINDMDIPDFQPLKDDTLAEKYCPYIISNYEYEYPGAVYYRISIDSNGNKHIAYHFFWEKEVNKNKGLVPWLTRNIYTGGIKLQEIMFGKHDIEVIGVVLDKNQNIKKVIYESPEHYNPYDFIVKHKTNEIADTVHTPLRFKVVSWNHLFEFVDNNYNLKKGEIELYSKPQYFTKKLWDEFSMCKKEETALKRNRAHYAWEREYTD